MLPVCSDSIYYVQTSNIKIQGMLYVLKSNNGYMGIENEFSGITSDLHSSSNGTDAYWR